MPARMNAYPLLFQKKGAYGSSICRCHSIHTIISMNKTRVSLLTILICAVVLIGVLSAVFTHDSTYQFDLDPHQVEKIQLFHSGDTVLVTDHSYVTRILDHFNSLTLEPESGLTVGFIYRITFLDQQDQVIYETDVLSEHHLLGRKVVEGAVDLDLLEAAYEAGTPVA